MTCENLARRPADAEHVSTERKRLGQTQISFAKGNWARRQNYTAAALVSHEAAVFRPLVAQYELHDQHAGEDPTATEEVPFRVAAVTTWTQPAQTIRHQSTMWQDTKDEGGCNKDKGRLGVCTNVRLRRHGTPPSSPARGSAPHPACTPARGSYSARAPRDRGPEAPGRAPSAALSTAAWSLRRWMRSPSRAMRRDVPPPRLPSPLQAARIRVSLRGHGCMDRVCRSAQSLLQTSTSPEILYL